MRGDLDGFDPSDIWDLDRDWFERQPTPDYLDELPTNAD